MPMVHVDKVHVTTMKRVRDRPCASSKRPSKKPRVATKADQSRNNKRTPAKKKNVHNDANHKAAAAAEPHPTASTRLWSEDSKTGSRKLFGVTIKSRRARTMVVHAEYPSTAAAMMKLYARVGITQAGVYNPMNRLPLFVTHPAADAVYRLGFFLPPHYRHKQPDDPVFRSCKLRLHRQAPIPQAHSSAHTNAQTTSSSSTANLDSVRLPTRSPTRSPPTSLPRQLPLPTSLPRQLPPPSPLPLPSQLPPPTPLHAPADRLALLADMMTAEPTTPAPPTHVSERRARECTNDNDASFDAWLESSSAPQDDIEDLSDRLNREAAIYRRIASVNNNKAASALAGASEDMVQASRRLQQDMEQTRQKPGVVDLSAVLQQSTASDTTAPIVLEWDEAIMGPMPELYDRSGRVQFRAKRRRDQ